MIRRLAAGLLFSLVGASTFMMGGLMRSPTRLSAETPTACSALLGDGDELYYISPDGSVMAVPTSIAGRSGPVHRCDCSGLRRRSR